MMKRNNNNHPPVSLIGLEQARSKMIQKRNIFLVLSGILTVAVLIFSASFAFLYL